MKREAENGKAREREKRRERGPDRTPSHLKPPFDRALLLVGALPVGGRVCELGPELRREPDLDPLPGDITEGKRQSRQEWEDTSSTIHHHSAQTGRT